MKLTLNDIEQWINNDEGLYNWWKESRQSIRLFMSDNRSDLEASIRRVLEAKPIEKTWRDYARNGGTSAW